MKFLDEFRDRSLCQALAKKAAAILGGSEATLMEVCGAHTVAILRSGIKTLLPPSLRLLSGPGCPVCVTPAAYLDKAVALSEKKEVILATFGDMMRVPGSFTSLEGEKAKGKNIAVVYSPLDSLRIAEKNPEKQVVFLGVGFETTSPSVAATVLEAKKRRISNFYILSGHKRIPPALELLARDPDLKVDGFILPGHVSTIIGVSPYLFLAQRYGIPAVVCGFEPLDVLQGICMLLRQFKEKRAEVEVQYKRSVKPEGNPGAVTLLNEVFAEMDSEWRGLGVIGDSGHRIGDAHKAFDANEAFALEDADATATEGCICGDILKGAKSPTQCPHFGKLCTPQSPVGPCMVSSEGTCAAHYRYG